MRFSVTQKDIDHGVKVACRECPVALALARKLGKGTKVYCSYGYTPNGACFKTPEKVQTFIKDFDNCLPVKPFRFEIPTL